MRAIVAKSSLVFQRATLVVAPTCCTCSAQNVGATLVVALPTPIKKLVASMLDTITNYIEQHQLLPEQGTIIVAVSGGADSLCLLHILHRLCGSGKRYPHLELHVAHLNHLLREEASCADADDVARLAADWGLPATIGTIDVPALARTEHRSIQQTPCAASLRGAWLSCESIQKRVG